MKEGGRNSCSYVCCPIADLITTDRRGGNPLRGVPSRHFAAPSAEGTRVGKWINGVSAKGTAAQCRAKWQCNSI